MNFLDVLQNLLVPPANATGTVAPPQNLLSAAGAQIGAMANQGQRTAPNLLTYDPSQYGVDNGMDTANVGQVAQTMQQPAPPLPAPVTVSAPPPVKEAPQGVSTDTGMQSDPWGGMRVVNAPAAVGAPSQTAAASPSFMDKYAEFTSNPRVQAIRDMFAGWAMGGTPQQSIGYGAKMMLAGSQQANDQNQTVEWLKSKGMDETQAKVLARNPTALNEVLQNMLVAKKPVAVAAGTSLYDPTTGKVVFTAPAGDGSKPAAIQEYEYAKAQGFPGTYQDWEASKKGGMSLQVDPATGQVTFQQGSNIKPMTEAQSKDTTYATRAEGTLPLVDKYGTALTNLPSAVGGNVPVVGNYMKSPEYQQAEQAGKEFLQAILRKDTGAAITKQETEEYGTVYLPQPGDSPQTLEQKRASRIRAVEAMKAGMTPQAILAQEKALAASGDRPQSSNNSGDPLGIR